MARKQSATIWFQGNPHKEIYFQGCYHDKMYIGNQLVWEKLSDTEIGSINVSLGQIARWKGKLYAVCQVRKFIGYKPVTVANNALVEYDLEKERWVMLSGDLGEITGKYISACDNGVTGFSHSESSGTDFRSTEFIDFSGILYNCPTEDITFLANAPYGIEIVTITNRGVLNKNGNLYEYYNTHSDDGKSLIIEGSSRIERGSVYNGNVYGYRWSTEVAGRMEAVKATITDDSINVVAMFSFDPEYKDGYYAPGVERIIDCWSDGYGAIITTEVYGESNAIVKRNYYDATTGGLLFSYDYWTTGTSRNIALLAMGENKEVAVMEVTGYETKINIHKNGVIADSIQVADGFYNNIKSSSKYIEQFFVHYNKDNDKDEVYFRTVKITDGITSSEAISNQETRVVG